MPSLGEHHSANIVKMLLIGNSGVGKTGSLASLPAAGYRLFIMDFDNGLDILRDPAILDPKYHPQVFFKTFNDPSNLANPKLAVPRAALEAAKAMNDWSEKEGEVTKSLGGPAKWGPQDVLVIDSLTFWGQALMRQVLFMNKRAGEQPWQSDWGEAIRMQEDTIGALYSDSIKCNVIIMAHLAPIEEKSTGMSRLYPSALGSKLPPKVGRYFNNMVLMERKATGDRVFKTKGTAVIDLKTSKPTKIPAEMPANMAEFFKLARGT